MSNLSAPPQILAPSADAIAKAGRLLRAGRLVALPTETVYGLAGDATDERAVAAIFAAKGRPHFNPLIIHYAADTDARRDAVFAETADVLARRFWPGPLTLVLPRAPNCRISLLASAGLDTVAVRVPAHDVARAVIEATGHPLAAPSANVSGAVSPTSAIHVAESLGDKVSLILDGGPCRVGIESTVIDLSGAAPTILRPGGLPREEIEMAIGPVVDDGSSDDAPRSPGRLVRHYATRLPLRLDAAGAREKEALLAFGPSVPSGARNMLNLSVTGDVVEAAANLFAMLRALDRPGECSGIAVMPVPERGLGRAINDRLRRAAERG
ncbi:MAG: L-threonylcarbamoyladenylate synthase [Alphaproteobacteria bacterium]